MMIHNPYHLALIAKHSYVEKHFETEDIEIIRDGDVFGFRGTDEWKDMITDIRFFPWYTRGLGINPAGFVRTADNVADLIEAVCWRDPPDAIALTGHSLGGAIALLVGAILIVRGSVSVNQIVTFGAPRVGRLKILTDVDVTMYRNGSDIIPTMPFYLKHPRKNIRIGKKMSPIKDHFMDNYVKELRVLPG